MRTFRRRHTHLHDDQAQTMAEYSVLMGFICLVVITALPQVGGVLRDFFSSALGVLGG